MDDVNLHVWLLFEVETPKVKVTHRKFTLLLVLALETLESCIVNRQIQVDNFKNVIIFAPLLTGHVIRRMCSGHIRIFNGIQREML